jgi:ferredoxin-fold anticodon binding domain-containing protein
MEVPGLILDPMTRVIKVLGGVSLLSKQVLGYNLGIGHDCFISHFYSTTVHFSTLR